MTDVLYLSKSEFADYKGCSPGYVTKLKDQGRLVMAPDGKRVDVHATEALIQDTADPSKAAVADRHQRDRVDRGVTAHLSSHAEPTAPAAVVISAPDFQKARARREHYLANLAEDEFRKGRGELVERAAVEQIAYTAGRTIRDLLMGLPPQISGELSALTDTWEIERRLTSAIRQALEDAEHMVAADMDGIITTK